MTDGTTDLEMVGARLDGLEALIKKVARSPFPIAASEQIDQLAMALAKAQGAFINPAKNREVSVQPKKRDDGTWPEKYTFSYSTLGAVADVYRKPLADNGLALVQPPVRTQDGLLVRTILMHESGQWMSSDLPALMKGAGAQDQGSAISYARRYAVCAMLGLVADEDEDGNAADGNRVDGFDKRPARPQRKGAAKDAPRDGFNAAEFSTGFLSQIAGAKTSAEVKGIIDMSREELDRLPREMRDGLVQKANARGSDLDRDKNATPIQTLANQLLDLVKKTKDRDALNELLVIREDDFAAIKVDNQKAYDALMANVAKRDAFLAEAA